MAPEARDRSPSLRPSPSDTRAPADPARGRRKLELAGTGRPLAWTDATGTTLRFDHDQDDNLCRIASGDWFVGIEGRHGQQTFATTDPYGRTEMRLSRGGRSRSIVRGEDRVSLLLDEAERLLRVELPGSTAALLYDWDDDGGCVIRAEGGRVLLHLEAAGAARRIRLDRETWIDEAIEPTRVSVSAAAGGAVVDTLTLELSNLTAISERRWADGSGDRYSRDTEGRLSSETRFDALGATAEASWTYVGADLASNEAGRRTLGEAGRVLALDRPDGTQVRYGYDAAGRRISRRGPDGETRYGYDPLGTLCHVELPDGSLVRYDTDGMGRRVASRHGGLLQHEHRDEIGRLWAVTDAAGQSLHVYIWVGDRIVARLDGPVGAPVAEAYLSDPLGTPNGVLIATEAGWQFERIAAPAFGRADNRARPTLYGHFADPRTGLIHFGARDLDPELGLFLNPDPWHGGDDDPRRWAGATDADLAGEAERATAGWHDYALCRFDPLGRTDRDGHVSRGDVALHILRFMLLPTWGFPMTAISLFFFQPVNFYLEIVGLIVWAFKQLCEDKTHPWRYHTIAKSQIALGSTRQVAFALGLNGFLPRVVAGGRNNDRAVTVGNVVWINREDLEVLGRAEVVDVHDISAGPTAFNNDATKRSLAALLCTDAGNRQRLHVAGWTHAPGNAVRSRTIGSVTADGFVDDPATAGAPAPGVIHLRQPIPLSIPVPGKTGDKEKIEVIEFVRPASTTLVQLETINLVQFALEVPTSTSFAKADWLRISASGVADVAYREVADVQDMTGNKALILDRELPASLAHNLKVEAIAPASGAAAIPGWTNTTATPKTLSLAVATPPPATATDLSLDAYLQVEAATATTPPAPPTAAPGFTPTPQSIRFAGVAALRSRLTLEPDRAGVAAGKKLARMVAGPRFSAVVAKAAARGKLTFTAPLPAIAKDDLLIIAGGTGTTPAYVRAKGGLAGGVLEIDPPLPAVLVPADATRLDVSKAIPLGDEPAVEVTAMPGTGADVDARVPRLSFLAVGNFVAYGDPGARVLRRVAAIPAFEADLTDEPVGTGPFKLTRAEPVLGKFRAGVPRAAFDRFLKVMSPLPSGPFGAWPNNLLAIHLVNTPNDAKALESAAYFVQWPTTGRPAGFVPEFRNTWSLTTQGTTQYIVLDAPLPLIRRKDDEDGKVKRWWRIQPDDYEGRSDILAETPILKLVASEYTIGARRFDVPGHRVLAHEPEALVPEHPRVHDTHRRTLIEHELNHTVQCNFWGPFMTALPLSGGIMTGADILTAAKILDPPEWLQPGNGPIPLNEDLNWFQILSIGGLMQMAWKYVFLLPFWARDDLRDSIKNWDFEDMNKVFSPVSRLISQAMPQVNPNASGGDRWLQVLLRVAARALDLRSWTPGPGFVPGQLPDGAASFLEQGASRASGDLYSTILTANDRYNLRTRNRLFGESFDGSANLHAGLGKPIRLLAYAGSRSDRTLPAANADTLDATPVYRQGTSEIPPFVISVAANPSSPPPTPASAIALLPAGLYTVTDPTGAPRPTIMVDPPSPGTTPAPFVAAFADDVVAPRPRAFVPLPPRVNRTTGFYLIGGGHCQMTVRAGAIRVAATIKLGGTVASGDTLTINLTPPGTVGGPITVTVNAPSAMSLADFADRAANRLRRDLPYFTAGMYADDKDNGIRIFARHGLVPLRITTSVSAGSSLTAKVDPADLKDDGKTETVTLSFNDEVKLGGELIPWQLPPASGAAPATPLQRFQLEENDLKVRAPRGTKSGNLGNVGIRELTLDADSTIGNTPMSDGTGWKLVMPKAVPTSRLRLKLFRTITKTDPAFDLDFPDVPTLAGVRSYLDGDVFIVVRDILLDVQPLPAIAAQTTQWDAPFELTIPIRLAQGVRAITITPPTGIAAPPVKRTGDAGRGEKWSFGPLPTRPAADAGFNVTITYGRPGNTEARTFVLTMKR